MVRRPRKDPRFDEMPARTRRDDKFVREEPARPEPAAAAPTSKIRADEWRDPWRRCDSEPNVVFSDFLVILVSDFFDIVFSAFLVILFFDIFVILFSDFLVILFTDLLGIRFSDFLILFFEISVMLFSDFLAILFSVFLVILISDLTL